MAAVSFPKNRYCQARLWVNQLYNTTHDVQTQPTDFFRIASFLGSMTRIWV
ncbi:MAG TPA: hypothetical protein VJ783_21190 [Pirellulales bacterium]|nr:hypothetical protein [Pirellulales bacterium]